jgi:hypothetical protein
MKKNHIEISQQMEENPDETGKVERMKRAQKVATDPKSKDLRIILRGFFLELAKRPPTDAELEILLGHREAISEFVDVSRQAMAEIGSSSLNLEVVYHLSRHPTLGGLGKLQNALGEVAKLIFKVIPLEEGQYLWGLHSSSIAGMYIEKLDPFLPKDQWVDPCLQALVAKTLQHERVHWLKVTGQFERDIPFASAIGWTIYHEVLSCKEIDVDPFTCKYEFEVGLVWRRSFEGWNYLSGDITDILIREADRLVDKYSKCNDEPTESYADGRRLAALALKHFENPIQSLIFFENMAEGQSAKTAMENTKNQWSSAREEKIRRSMRDEHWWDFMKSATDVSDKVGVKNDRTIRGFFTVNTLNSLESGLSVGVEGVRQVPRFLYLRPPLA